MTLPSPTSSPQSPPSSLDLETVQRLTRLEIKADTHTARLSLHERAILGLAGALYVLAQDKFPLVAAAIRGLLIP